MNRIPKRMRMLATQRNDSVDRGYKVLLARILFFWRYCLFGVFNSWSVILLGD